MNRAGGRVSRGELAGTQCRGFTRSGIRHWGGFEDNGSCVATGFASFMPAVRRAKVEFTRHNPPGTVAPARSRLSGLHAGKRSARSLAAWCRASLQLPRACGQFRTGASQRRGNGAKAARSHAWRSAGIFNRKKRGCCKPISPASRAAASSPPRRHPRAAIIERLRRVDWHGDNRARRGVIRARVKRKARRAGLSLTGDGVPVQGR